MAKSPARPAPRRSTEAQTLLEAIIDNPDDDRPRLAYADWLEKHSDPRAQLIRVECQLASLDEEDPRRVPLNKSRDNLLDAYTYDWFTKLPGSAAKIPIRTDEWPFKYRRKFDVYDIERKFSRGFLNYLQISAAHFIRDAAKIWAREPVSEAQIAVKRSEVVELARCPYLANLSALDLSQNKLGDKGLCTFLKSRHLGRLRYLDLSDNEIGPAGAEALVNTRQLKNLTTLDLGFNSLGAEGAAILAAADWPHLTKLPLPANEIGPQGVAVLAQSRLLANLTFLDLMGNPPNQPLLEDDGLKALACSPYLGKLEDLTLGSNHLSTAGVQALLASRTLTCLRRLDLADNQLGDGVTKALLRWPHLAKVRELDLGNCNLSAASATTLLKARGLGLLRMLDLSSNRLGDEVVCVLSRTAALTEVRKLGLNGCNIGDRGVAALARSRHLVNLRELLLFYNRISNRGALALASSSGLTKIKYLGLQSRQVKSFDPRANLIGEAGQAALEKRFRGRMSLW